jgi:hypothetical protein
VNYAFRVSGPVTFLTARRVWDSVNARLICRHDPFHAWGPRASGLGELHFPPLDSPLKGPWAHRKIRRNQRQKYLNLKAGCYSLKTPTTPSRRPLDGGSILDHDDDDADAAADEVTSVFQVARPLLTLRPSAATLSQTS